MLNIPQTINEVYNRIVADFKTYNKKAQPAVKNSWIGAILISLAGRLFDIYKKLNFILKQAFIDTASGEYLKRWGSYVNIYQKQATKSHGNFIFTGNEGSLISVGTQIIANSINYTTNQSIELVKNEIITTDYTQESDLVTITFDNMHNLGTGMTIKINNIDCTVEVIDAYTIQTSIEDTLSGQINIQYVSNIVSCTPNEYGKETNLVPGETGKTQTVISGVDINCYTDYQGFTGGQDIESEENLKSRIIYRYQNPVTNFNNAAITTFVNGLSGVGDVKVYDITPEVGQVTIYYLLQDNKTPDAGHIQLVTDSIDSDLRPANTDMSDIFIYSAIPVIINPVITNLQPNTTAIKQAVSNSITEYFSTMKIGYNFYRNDLIEVIKNSVDMETGLGVISFNLDSSIVDVTVTNGQFIKLGNISL